MMTREEIITKAESFGDWYHRIELVPGYWTKSRMKDSWHIWDMIHRVRAGIDYKVKSVLDIGTMDGMWAFEAVDLGATDVHGCDVWQEPDAQHRFEFAINIKGHVKYHRWDAERLSDYCIMGQFDIIQCLGMLYHVENPLRVLREIRACINPDGKLLLETACSKSYENYPFAILNTREDIYCDSTTFWVPNQIALMDMLKLSGFKPLEETVQVSQEPRSYRTCMICEPI